MLESLMQTIYHLFGIPVYVEIGTSYRYGCLDGALAVLRREVIPNMRAGKPGQA